MNASCARRREQARPEAPLSLSATCSVASLTRHMQANILRSCQCMFIHTCNVQGENAGLLSLYFFVSFLLYTLCMRSYLHLHGRTRIHIPVISVWDHSHSFFHSARYMKLGSKRGYITHHHVLFILSSIFLIN